MMNRVFNFGAGPATLPEEILLNAQQELLNWQNLGLSILEVNHRSDAFTQVLDHAEKKLRSLLSIPENYHVLFLNGPARLQFSMVPMNLLAIGEHGAYLTTGLWSNLAFEEAKRLKKATLYDESALNPKTKYVYFTPNETVDGLRTACPKTSLPIIADMTSCLLTEPINISDYSLIFAGAQKNIANAGLTIVIIKDNLLSEISRKALPILLDYRTHIENHSLYATPPTFNCYLASKMFDWVEKNGGVQTMYSRNLEKSALLYAYIDSTNFYHCTVPSAARSLINVCFWLKNESLNEKFIADAEHNGLVALKGHRCKGGMRASLYNAMPIKGVFALIEFMKAFAREHG